MASSTWPPIPPDVVAWFRRAFAKSNSAVSKAILDMPSIRETSLDDILVSSLVPFAAPTILPSGAFVRMDIHNVGGLRRYASWEIADIAIIVFVVQSGKIRARKIGLLQAKRLYPKNSDVDDEDPVGFLYGMNALLHPNPSPTSMALHRTFHFSSTSKYAALTADSDQIKTIANFQKSAGHDVFYLFYNPPSLPITIKYPLTKRSRASSKPKLGCRVATANEVHTLLSTLPAGSSPSFAKLKSIHPPDGGWRLEYWAADLLLACKVGREFSDADEGRLLPLIERRTGPIGAAIAAHIELPKDWRP